MFTAGRMVLRVLRFVINNPLPQEEEEEKETARAEGPPQTLLPMRLYPTPGPRNLPCHPLLGSYFLFLQEQIDKRHYHHHGHPHRCSTDFEQTLRVGIQHGGVLGVHESLWVREHFW
jgi:hypothetical protein